MGLFLSSATAGIGQIRPTPLRLYRKQTPCRGGGLGQPVFPQVFAEDDPAAAPCGSIRRRSVRGPRRRVWRFIRLIAAAERGGSDADRRRDAPPTPADRRVCSR